MTRPTIVTSTEAAAIDRHCDLMRQGFMKLSKVPAPTAAEIKDAQERAAVILRKLEAYK